MQPLLVKNLNKSYAGLIAVKDLNLELKAGEMFGFLGHNGAGKSTSIRMLCGFLRPDSGEIRIFGMDPFDSPVEIKRRIGIMPDSLQMYDRLTGWEFLEFCARMHSLESSLYKQRIQNYAEALGLSEKLGVPILHYSHGMRQKIALIASILHHPRLLFLDEPFTGMDAVSVIHVRQLLLSLKNEGTTIFFSSHILEIVEKICDRIGIIAQARLQTVGTLAEILALHQVRNLEEHFLNLGRDAAKTISPA